jgi:hypothetical protein
MKRICALTMARNDAFFLKKWISYYSQQLGEENLYVFLDGEDQPLPPNTKAHVQQCPKIEAKRTAFDKVRMAFLSEQAALLFQQGYEVVIGCDTDEFLVIDPNCNTSLAAYLSQVALPGSLSGLGIDVGQHLTQETAIDWTQPFLQQRSYALLSTRYTKPVVLGKPLRWGSGFHRVKGRNFSIDPNLYLFHFGSFDMKMIEDRYQDKDRMSAGWEKHIDRRAKTIYMVSNSRAKTSEKYLKWSRWLQSTFRLIYALNKPSMCWIKWIVCIPKRFSNIL